METYGLEQLGIISPSAVYRNLSPAILVEKALARGEGKLNSTGALCVNTGKYTGRSPNDKFIVDSAGVHDEIAWGKVNVPTTQEVFDALYEKMVAYLQNREIFIFDGFAGADPKYTKAFRVINELASQNLFIHQLLLRPTEEALANYKPDFTIICAPGFKCIPERDHVNSEAAIMIDYEKKMVLIAGSQYAGEIKKSVFSVMNYLMPKEGVFPMHCSANIGEAGDSAIFFGLSGTGNLRSGTEHLFRWLHHREGTSGRSALVYYGLILSFVAGAVLSGLLTPLFGTRTVLTACLPLLLSLALMFRLPDPT